MPPRLHRLSSPLRRDLAVGGSVGLAVCTLAVVAGVTLGPKLGHDLPESTSGQAVPEVISLPRIERPALVKADPQPRRRPAAGDEERTPSSPAAPQASSVAQPTIERPAPGQRTAAPSAPLPGPVPGIVTPSVPVTPAPPAAARDSEPATVPITGAGDVAGPSLTDPKTPRHVDTPVAARGLTLRVASVSVVRTDDPEQPELRVNMAISGAAAGSGVPDQVALRLRPELPGASATTPAAPLALRTHVDVVTSTKRIAADASKPDAAPLDMRVRMAVAPADPAAPTVRDRGDGGGKSNLLEVTVPLSAFAAPAPEAPAPAPAPAEPDDSGPGSHPGTPADDDDDEDTDAPDTGAPAQPEPRAPAQPEPGAPAQPEPAAQQPTEVLLTLTPGSEGPTSPSESTTIPLPATGTGGSDAVDPLPVRVVVDSTPASAPPADVITDLPVEVTPPPTGSAPVPGLGDVPAVGLGNGAPADPGTPADPPAGQPATVTSTPETTPPATTAPADTGGIPAPDAATTAAP